MATKLGKLRSDLVRLQTTRTAIRGASGLSLLLTSLVAILVIAFVADFLLDMSRAQRVVLAGLVVAAAIWAWRRFAKPWFQQKDDPLELALMVERQQGIDSDLVSALQFEEPAAKDWGSEQLEQAVITHVAEITPKIDVLEGLPMAEVKRRLTTTGFVLLAVMASYMMFPGYVGSFLNRMFLGQAQYPTKTKIVSIRVNGHDIVLNGNLSQARPISSPIGHRVRFEVTGGGELPVSGDGVVRIESLDGNIATDVELSSGASLSSSQTEIKGSVDESAEPDTEESAKAGAEQQSSSPELFRGELPRLMDSVTFQVFLGDARTLPIRIDAIPLPIVDLKLDVTPPAYAAAAENSADQTGSNRQLSVVEGSRVDVRLKCLNKTLESGAIWIGEDEYHLTLADSKEQIWSLTAGSTPLESVSEPIRYRVQVSDDQGLQLESPIHGTIRLRTDQPPRTAVSMRTRKFVPTARPPIDWSASDDFGLSRVVALVQVARTDGEVSASEIEIAARPQDGAAPTSLKGTYRLDLSELKLVKGDELKVTFSAYDFRGDGEPRRSFSEPIILQITDQQGIVSGLLETDGESAKQLDAIIRRELGIGERK